jgi:hypothetical protein
MCIVVDGNQLHSLVSTQIRTQLIVIANGKLILFGAHHNNVDHITMVIKEYLDAPLKGVFTGPLSFSSFFLTTRGTWYAIGKNDEKRLARSMSGTH